jgi:PKHD-type hydroxylase
MFIQIPDLLDKDDIKTVVDALEKAKFIDGKVSVMGPAAAAKNNQILDRDKMKDTEALDQIIISKLGQAPAIRSGCLPKKILAPSYCKYEKGMSYTPHTDHPVMGNNPPVRTDIAVVVFLSDPDSYEGGELAVKSEVGDITFKPEAGHAVVYPGGVLHSTQEVTKGVRLVAVTWIQSIISDAAKRHLLLELDMAAGLVNKNSPNSDESRILAKTHGNLMRMWSEI